MMKKYKAKSCISITVALSTGGTTHVSFNPVTGGGSVYYTKNPIIQAGLENHPKYGKLFTLDSSFVQSAKPNTSKPSAKTPDAATESEGTTKKVVEVKMSCNDDAKDYLVEKFGISRTKLRSRAQIEAAGVANGVKFIWE